MRARLWAVITAIGLLFLVSCALLPVATPTPQPPTPSPTSTATHLPPQIPASAGLPAVVDVVGKVRPAVAAVWVELDIFFRGVPQQVAGSGVIFDADGHILTNNHVVARAQKLNVTLPDGRAFEATIVGRDPATDLAVIKIEGDNLPVATLGDSETLRIGDWVIAIGNSLALPGGPTVTVGVVGALGRTIQESDGTYLDDLIQTDAAINPGNSGGPLTNLAGEVVGINTAIAGGAQGIGFAVSMTTAKPVVEQILAHGMVRWAWLGVSIEQVTPALAAELKLAVSKGALIRTVQRGGPAATAGLQVGDVIIAIDGNTVDTIRQLQEEVRRHEVGSTVDVTYLRDQDQRTVSAILAEMPRGL